MMTNRAIQFWATTSLAFLTGCGGDDGTEADRLGVAAECAATTDCAEVEIDDETVQLECLPQFKGGYCAIEDCMSAADCPEGSTCVAHDDGQNYCFRICTDKAECNRNRSGEAEANCSASFDFADPNDDQGYKACIPPSGSAG
jgi:hypothetical protein